MTILVWFSVVLGILGFLCWGVGEVFRDAPVRNELVRPVASVGSSFTKSQKMQLGLRILEAIYCNKGSISWSRVICIAIILNVALYNLINFASIGMIVLQEMIKAGVPASELPKSFGATLLLSWRLIDFTEFAVWANIVLFFSSAIVVDFISVYATLAFYRYALSKNSLWPILLNLCLLILFLYAIPYLYFYHTNKPFLAYLLSNDYLHFSLFGLPGAQMFLVEDSFAYRQVIFSDQRAYQVLGFLAPISAIIPISIVIVSLPISLVASVRSSFSWIRNCIVGKNASLLVRFGQFATALGAFLLGVAALR